MIPALPAAITEPYPAARWHESQLIGPLAPFRNVHKFDPLLRLPLALDGTEDPARTLLDHLDRLLDALSAPA